MTPSRKVVPRSWLITGAAVLIAVAAGLAWLRMGVQDRDLAPAKVSAGAANPSSATIVAGRGLALAALRQGRFDQAIDFYRGLRSSDWQAEDCLALSDGLLERGRTGLGRAALEAARRIDPRDQATTAAFEAFERKQAATNGRERSALREAESRVEPVRSIPNAPPLGLLVLALARFASGRDQEEDFFDRIRARYLASLKQLNAPDDAIKLAARLLLETGRPGEARDLLDSLVRIDAAARPAPDREAAWLLSRAALQLGAHETADAMLARAGDFGQSPAAQVEPSPFIGSRRCGECHRSIHRTQQRQSRHAQTLRFLTQLKNVPLPDGPVADEVVPGISHSFKRKNDSEIVLESRTESQVFRAIVEYAVGSGRHGITMLARDEEGVEREVRISYFGQDGGWGQTKGITFAPQTPGDHAGVGMGQQAVNQCLSCHTTWFRAVRTDSPGTRPPEGEDQGIGCERCHGPGMNHALAAQSGFAEMAIALSSRTPSRTQLDSCVECHAEDGTIPPSDPEFTRFHGTTFLLSPCFIANQDSFSCTTCHDPHRALETQTAPYEAKCLRCHSGTPPTDDAAPAGASARSAEMPVTVHGKLCPVNRSTGCIACHMPKVQDPSRHARWTDHHIRPHGPTTPLSRH